VPIHASPDTSRGGLIDLLVASMTSASKAFSRDQKQLLLLAALDKLPAEQREALRLRYVDGLPSKDIAQRLGKTDGAVRVMLTRSLAKLQQILGVDSAGSEYSSR
jgi:RNA polymerase sigma-70 factor (ECF subfamily)